MKAPLWVREKLKKNNRNKRKQLKGAKHYYDKIRGIVLVDEKKIKEKLKKRFNKIFI